MLAANQPLVVPMLLRLSNFKLNSYVVLVVSKPKGITLVFKTDPLQNVDINSTFDSIAVIQKFIQQEIEGQLRQMFREDLPGIIHRLSQRWVRSTTAMGVNMPKTRVEAPYLKQRPPFLVQPRHPQLETMSNPDLSRFAPASAWQPSLIHPHRRPGLNPRAVSLAARSVASKASYGDLRGSGTAATASRSEIGYSGGFESDRVADEIDDGPDFGSLRRLHRPSRGLVDLVEDPETESLNDARSMASIDPDEVSSFDVVEWEDTVPDMSVILEEDESLSPKPAHVEYETIPAVGGGYISRPRVIHSTSYHHNSNSTSSVSSSSPRAHKIGVPATPSMTGSRLSESFTEGFPSGSRSFIQQSDDIAHIQYARSIAGLAHLQISPPSGSLRSEPIRRRASVSRSQAPNSPFLTSQPDSSLDPTAGDLDMSSPQIILQPGLNNNITQLSLLNHSNHTLSPYARTLEHFMIRSAPPRERGGIGVMGLPTGQDRQPVKARRKRTYRLGGKKPIAQDSNAEAGPSVPNRDRSPASSISPPTTPPMPSRHLSPPLSPSEFDESDIDRYFRPYDSQPQTSQRGVAEQILRANSPTPLMAAPSHFKRRTSHRSLRT